jgi:hypothetical protein
LEEQQIPYSLFDIIGHKGKFLALLERGRAKNILRLHEKLCPGSTRRRIYKLSMVAIALCEISGFILFWLMINFNT